VGLQWTQRSVALLLKCVLNVDLYFDATVLNMACLQWTSTAVALLNSIWRRLFWMCSGHQHPWCF
jgi:hypothetical protein